MAEVWAAAGAVATIAGGVLSGRAAAKKDKSDKSYESKETRALAQDKAKYGAIESLFNSQLEDYYSQLNRQRKQRGLDQFRQFSSVAPQYQGTGTRIQMPAMPTVADVSSQIDQAGMSKPYGG